MGATKDILSPFLVWKHFFRQPVTIKEPLKRQGAPRYRGFHINDITECIGCGTCESICENQAIDLVPVDGIETRPGDSGLRPKVDYGRCCWCALCVDVCTTGSLKLTNAFTWADSNPDVFRYIPGVDDKPWDECTLGYRKAEELELYPLDRVAMQHLHPEERFDSFVEIIRGYSREEALKEADRCVACGICTATCPAHMGIPEYIQAIRQENIEEGLRIMYETNPLPEICGRICTHKCETVCSVGHRGDPLSIRWLKRYLADQVPASSYAEILRADSIENSDHKIAIIGAGPAGLSAAYYLRMLGHQVTIFEKLNAAGGMMRYGIPEYRLPYDQLDKDINYILSLGVEIRYGIRIGTDVLLSDLEREFDAVYAATGLHEGRSTRIPGTQHPGVYQSIDLLRRITLGEEIEVAPRVVVIGGGNVAMDITRSIARLQRQKFGKVEVIATSLETEDIMPADREEIVEAREEGAIIHPGWGPREIVIENNRIKGLKVVQCLSVFDENKRFNPRFDESVQNFFEADMVIESIGQGADLSYIPNEYMERLEKDHRGRILADTLTYQTNISWLFLGGDIIEGPDVIHGIANGHKAARGIDQYLNAKKQS
ncbi:MAG: FAD-dependent oxidoreductase [Bacteroidales bacterium]|nr:FAD-dependent oxidoreductase [Bacteroidales bacterium]